MANKYLDLDGLSSFWNKIKTFLSNDAVVHKTKSIAYGALDSTSTATVMTAQIPGITELADGVAIWLKNGVITSASGFTLNINNLGAKPVYQSMAAATRVTTLFNVAYTMLFVYDSTRVEGGCWVMYYGYNSNSDTISTNLMRLTYGQFKPTDSLTRYKICFTKDEDEVIPVTTVSNSTGTSKALTTASFNPFAPIYYYSTTTTVEAGSLIDAASFWYAYNTVDLRYSFNAGSTLVANTDVYIKATFDGSMATLATDQPIVQALPSTDDGYIYIKLGRTRDTYRVALTPDHPIYIFKDGKVRQLSAYSALAGNALTVGGHTVAADVPSGALFTDTVTTATTSGDGNAVTSITASNGALTVTKGSTFLTSHQDISGKADKSTTVTNVAYDSTNKKITKTINGTTSDVVSVATIKSDMSLSKSDVGLGNVDNTADASKSVAYAANSGTVNNHTVASDVPADAVFTDTVTTASTTGDGNAVTAISASNGVLTVTKGTTFLTSHQDISGKADKATTVTNVAYDSTNKKITKTINGTTTDVVAVSAIKTDLNLSKTDVGLGNVDNTADADKSVAYADNAAKVNNYSVNANVPANAVFTDTVYTLPTATSSVLGGVKIGNGITITDGAISAEVPSIQGISVNGVAQTPTNKVVNIGIPYSSVSNEVLTVGAEEATGAEPYTLPVASSSTLGGVMIGSGITITNGVISAITQAQVESLISTAIGNITDGDGVSY